MTDDPLLVAINSARMCIERFRVRPESTDLLSTALRELDDAMGLLPDRSEPVDSASVEDAIRAELIALGVSAGVDVMARRVRRRLEADGLLVVPGEEQSCR
jgi:hypothetical protein